MHMSAISISHMQNKAGHVCERLAGRGRALMQRAVHEPMQKTNPPQRSPAGVPVVSHCDRIVLRYAWRAACRFSDVYDLRAGPFTDPKPALQIGDFVQRKRGASTMPG